MTVKRTKKARARERREQYRELVLVHRKLSSLLGRDGPRVARQIADLKPRFLSLVQETMPDEETYFGADQLALCAELEEDWVEAARLRKKRVEIHTSLIGLAYTIENPAGARTILKTSPRQALEEALGLLAEDLWKAGQPREALRYLDSARTMCTRFRLKFTRRELRARLIKELAEADGAS